MAGRNRIIYASQSVIVEGDFQYRVQTLGASTSFASTDLFELGQQDVIDVVDDVPTVSVTIDTNDWGTVRTSASFARVDSSNFGVTATITTGNLVSKNGVADVNFYHGVTLADYSGAGSEFDLWAPVQAEASLGTHNDVVEQTMFMSRCFTTGISLNYSTGGESTENFTAETDNKTWFLNDGRFISQEEWTTPGTTFNLGLLDGTNQVASLSDANLAFLYSDPDSGRRCLVVETATGDRTYVPVIAGAITLTEAGYDAATNVVTLPVAIVPGATDIVKIRYAADAYADGTGDSTSQKSNYFTPATDANTSDHSNVGGLRQGQVEIYLVDPDSSTDYQLALRLQSVDVSTSLSREGLLELGHLRAYDRPVNYPIEISTSVNTTAGDLETFAKFSGKDAEFAGNTLIDLSIDHLLAKDNLILVVMIYDQTDIEAGGTGANRKVLTDELAGRDYQVAGAVSTYAAVNLAAPEREYPLKTVIIPGLKSTSDGYNASVGSNATQTFAFKSSNKMAMVKGFVPFSDILLVPGIQNK